MGRVVRSGGAEGRAIRAAALSVQTLQTLQKLQKLQDLRELTPRVVAALRHTRVAFVACAARYSVAVAREPREYPY